MWGSPRWQPATAPGRDRHFHKLLRGMPDCIRSLPDRHFAGRCRYVFERGHVNPFFDTDLRWMHLQGYVENSCSILVERHPWIPVRDALHNTSILIGRNKMV